MVEPIDLVKARLQRLEEIDPQKAEKRVDPSTLFDIELTEDGLARAFSARFADSWRFDWTSGKWYEWAGYRWQVDETNRAFTWLRDLARAGSERSAGSKLEKVRKAAFAGGAERFARSDPVHAVTAKVWDKDPWLLGTPGGTVDLKLGKIIDPDPADGITRLTGVAPDMHSSCPQWLAFLDQATGEDSDLIRFLQGWCGYSLTGSTREHALPFLFGPGGNGKALTEHRASEGLRQWRDKAGLTPEALGYALRLQDARGTAATRLLNAGLSLAEIASHMGWSVRHAANVIEHYATVSTDESDSILVKLALAKGNKK